MRNILAVGLLFYSLQVTAQSYNITYETVVTAPMTINHLPVITKNKSRLVFNDTMSYWYNFPGNRDKFKKKKNFGRKFLNNSYYYRKNSGFLERALSNHKAKHIYLIFDTANVTNWILLEREKVILGYKCSAALSVAKNNDSTLVYYAKDISQPYGPQYYHGLDGVILEVIEQRGRHIIAISIKNEDYLITYPDQYISISKDKFALEKQNIFGKNSFFH